MTKVTWFLNVFISGVQVAVRALTATSTHLCELFHVCEHAHSRLPCFAKYLTAVSAITANGAIFVASVDHHEQKRKPWKKALKLAAPGCCWHASKSYLTHGSSDTKTALSLGKTQQRTSHLVASQHRYLRSILCHTEGQSERFGNGLTLLQPPLVVML